MLAILGIGTESMEGIWCTDADRDSSPGNTNNKVKTVCVVLALQGHVDESD